MNAVEITGLTYSYPGASQPTLNGISLKIEKGDFLAVVGNNGCGKSTLCKVLNGLIPHFITGDFRGEVRVEGLNTLESEVGTLAQKSGMSIRTLKIKSSGPPCWMTPPMPA